MPGEHVAYFAAGSALLSARFHAGGIVLPLRKFRTKLLHDELRFFGVPNLDFPRRYVDVSLIFLQIFRAHLASSKNQNNWFAALQHPGLAKVLEAMHAECGTNWSLDRLAKAAGMSRSTFALKFKKHMGLAPMDYLTKWRMQIASELLKDGQQSTADIARAIGYASESAFNVAFKRVIKATPGVYRKNSVQSSIEKTV